MNNEDMSLKWLYGLSKHGIKLGLKNITELLKRLGNPHNSFRSIHVAGTDGKGSTCAMLASIFNHSGIKTGLYTSPHILEFNERISISGKNISDEDLATLIMAVKPHVEKMREDGMQCTFFEVATAVAFLYFKEQKVEYAIVEVGMGGRYDATNVITPEVSVITNISLEHTEYLGDTIEKIAFEKAGIIKKGIPVVTMNSGKALDVIIDVASETGANIFVADECEIVALSENFTVMQYGGKEYTIGIPGDYQAINAEMVIEAVAHTSCYNRLEPHVREGLYEVKWPCRMQKIEELPLIIDVSHTGAGSKVMTDNIAEIYGKTTVVFGVLGDKDIDAIAENLSNIASRIYLTMPDSERAAPMDRVEKTVREHIKNVTLCSSFDEAMSKAMKERGNENVLVTGSLFMAEGALKWLKKTYPGY